MSAEVLVRKNKINDQTLFAFRYSDVDVDRMYDTFPEHISIDEYFSDNLDEDIVTFPAKYGQAALDLLELTGTYVPVPIGNNTFYLQRDETTSNNNNTNKFKVPDLITDVKKIRKVQPATSTSMYHYEKIVPILEHYANILQKDIECKMICGIIAHDSKSLNNDPKNKLNIFMGPTIYNQNKQPISGGRKVKTINDIKLYNWQNDAYKADTINTNQIIFSDDGVPLAQYYNGNIFILFNYLYTRDSDKRKTKQTNHEELMIYILNMFIKYAVNNNLKEYKLENAVKQISESEKVQQNIDKNSYVKHCAKRLESQIKEFQKQLAVEASNIDTHMKAFVEASRKHAELQFKLQSHDVFVKKSEEMFQKEYERIFAISNLESLTIKNEQIIATTKHLHTIKLKDGTTRDLGKYRITIYIDGRTIPRIENLTRKVRDTHHPHESGGWCFGNIGPGLVKLTAEYEYSALIQMIIRYLIHVNELDDRGSSVYNWPITKTIKKEQ